MVNLCTVVPAGVVCFFPSYEYEEKVYMKWAEKGYIKRIELRKKVSSFIFVCIYFIFGTKQKGI